MRASPTSRRATSRSRPACAKAATRCTTCRLRITINRELVIVDAEAASDAVPYPGYCDTIAPAYKSLIGLSLTNHFRLRLKDRLAGVLGCTHLTELSLILPTAAIQAYANDVIKTRDGDGADESTERPFQLDRCYALRVDGPAVAKYYPRWVVKKAVNS